MEIDLPYRVEYSKSSRAACKSCKTPILQGTVRLACLVQSSVFDGKMASWFHEKCFFQKQRPKTEGDIENFEGLDPKDQSRLRTKIDQISAGVVVPSSSKETKGAKGKKRSNKEDNVALKDYGVELAKSGRAGCRGCEQKIAKDEVRIKKVVFDTEVGMKYGGQPLWHHAECFAQVRTDLGWFETGEKLPGFNSLPADEKEKIKKLIPAMKSEDIPAVKKLKTESTDEVDSKLEKQLEKQASSLYQNRESLQKDMKKSEVIELLTANRQEVPVGDTGKLYDIASDLVTFGALKPCEQCRNGQFIFHKSGYLCTGNVTDWAKCTNNVKEPPRVACVVPKDLINEYPFLKQFHKKKPKNRAIKYIPPSEDVIKKSVPIKKEEELEGPKVKREKPPLYLLEFVIVGLKESEENLKRAIQKLGGKVGSKVHEKLAAVISTEKEVAKLSRKIATARELDIQVVPADYVETVKDCGMGAISYIVSKSICDWGSDPHSRIPKEDTSAKSKSIYTKSVPKSMKLTVKDGLAVDPDSGLDDVAHVYVEGKDRYNAVLGLTDIQSKKNSYYKLQLLERDGGNAYWIFRSWGRIGTTIGGNKVEKFSSLRDAKKNFEAVYLDKSGNYWENREYFEKIPGFMYPIDIDYEDDDKLKKMMTESKVKSKLPKPVADLMRLIFDVDAMKKVMVEFHLDMEKMPLGKLSQKQIQSAYKVLTELSSLIQKGGTNAQFIDGTNRFYTLIPHNFGTDNPPLLDTAEKINKHIEVLDSLMEIECAVSMLNAEEQKDDVNPLDQHYDQLKTELAPIDRNSEEFKTLEKYIQNTHAETHRSYELEIVDILKVARKGEARRYKPFKKLHNRKLLWHGSRLTNYAGILSHGLKIAPPEAPVTGYMFGKGIYFADMVSKSANYCFTSSQNSTGVMLLSEVALGDMFECNQANYVTKLPKDKHSTKGIGRTQPDPKESHMRDDGVEIPLGKPVTDDKTKSSLLYNEFIVYDVAQVNIQYLLRMNFKYKY